MSNNRFAIIHSQPNITHVTTCPILYVSGRLLYDRRIKDSLIQLKFQNIVDGIINSVIISIDGYNEDNKKIIDSMLWEYKNLSIKRDDTFGSEVAIYLNNVNVKSYSLTIQKITYIHNNKSIKWENNNDFLNYTIDIKSMREKLGDELKNQYNKEDKCKYDNTMYQEYDDLWICTCGAINQTSEHACHKCGKELSWLKSHNNSNYLSKKFSFDYLKKQKELDEKVRKKKKNIGIAIVILCLFALILSFPSLKKSYEKTQIRHREQEEARKEKELTEKIKKDIEDFYHDEVEKNIGGWVPEKMFNDSESDNSRYYRYYKDYAIAGIDGRMYYGYFNDKDFWGNDIFITRVGWETNDDTYAEVIKNVILDMSTDKNSSENEPYETYTGSHEYTWYKNHELVNDDIYSLYMVVDGFNPKIILEWD